MLCARELTFLVPRPEFVFEEGGSILEIVPRTGIIRPVFTDRASLEPLGKKVRLVQDEANRRLL